MQVAVVCNNPHCWRVLSVRALRKSLYSAWALHQCLPLTNFNLTSATTVTHKPLLPTSPLLLGANVTCRCVRQLPQRATKDTTPLQPLTKKFLLFSITRKADTTQSVESDCLSCGDPSFSLCISPKMADNTPGQAGLRTSPNTGFKCLELFFNHYSHRHIIFTKMHFLFV